MIKFSGSRSYSLFSYWQLYRHHTSAWHADYSSRVKYKLCWNLISPSPGCTKINLASFFCNTLALALAKISRYTVLWTIYGYIHVYCMPHTANSLWGERLWRHPLAAGRTSLGSRQERGRNTPALHHSRGRFELERAVNWMWCPHWSNSSVA